ncbi:MAG: cobalt ECF transporter T component CbiQ [Candidatus Omnitrophica bacterium]|nr:cobalt ECF transporter T component CbiQ [Candidatus Omnitrophota bacterium]
MKHSYIDEHSNKNSLIQNLDPMVKIIGLFLFIFFIIFTRPNSFVTFGLYGVLIITLTLFSKIPVNFVIKRSLIIIPFVLLVSLFIPFMNKSELSRGYSSGTLKLNISRDGLLIFWNILAKSYLSILCMILLAASTNFSKLLKAFEKLGIPKIITMILSFMYRYIFVVQDELMKMREAKESRSVGGSRWFHIKTLANMVGVLFIRTYERGESVYLAMCARGFEGSIKIVDSFQLKRRDFSFILVLVGLLIFIRLFGG